jgi:hypothetical protein
MGLTTVEVLQDHPQAAFIREGEAIVTDATPPGRDPLLPPASGVVVDVEEEQIDEATRQEEAAERTMPSTDESLDRAEREMDQAVKDIDEALAAEKGEKAEKPKKKAARKKKPVVDQEAPFIATCSVDGCGKEFDPHREVHWNHEGVFRCSSCGQFPK